MDFGSVVLLESGQQENSRSALFGSSSRSFRNSFRVKDRRSVDAQWFHRRSSQAFLKSNELSVYMTFGFSSGSENFSRLPATILYPQRVVVGTLEVAMVFRSTLDTSQRWCHPMFDESFCTFRVLEFKMCPRRSLAALLQDGPSHVRRSNHLFWHCDVLRYTTQYMITAYNCNCCFLGFRVLFRLYGLALHCCLNVETPIFRRVCNLHSSRV